MADSQQEFTELIRRVREGDQQAIQELLDRYGSHIQRVVRRKLDKKIRTKFDSLDFVQDVWLSFFANHPDLDRFDRPEALIGYLEKMARNKVVDEYRHRYQTQRSNIQKERSLDGSAAFAAQGVPAAVPTPSQVASANEEWERLVGGTPVHYRRILVLLQDGKSCREAAEEVGCDERTVRRVIKRLSQRNIP